MRKANKIVSILVTLCMLLSIMAPAFAADTTGLTVPKVKTGDERRLGDLLLVETVQGTTYSTGGDFVLTVELPTGVEFSEKADVVAEKNGSLVTVPANVKDKPNALATGDVEVKQVGSNYVTFEVKSATGDSGGKAGFVFNLSKYDVDIASSAAGDLKVKVKAEGTPFESGEFLVGRASKGDTTVTVATPETIGRDSAKAAQIKIEENAVGTFDVNDEIKVVLPKDIDWDVTETLKNISAVGFEIETPSASSFSGDTLKLVVKTKSTKYPGFVTITPVIDADDDFKAGDVEATVKGDNITSTDVVIAKVADYDVMVKLDDNDVKTVVAGVFDNEIDQINIEETVADSFLKNRTITLELPDYAHFTALPTDMTDESKVYTEGGITYTVSYDSLDKLAKDSSRSDKKYPSKITLRAKDNAGKDAETIELDGIEIAVDADAPAGDLKLEIAGTLGIKAELVIAKVVAPVTVKAANKDVKIGIQNQTIGDIQIVESVDGAITKDGKYLYVKAPTGVKFSEVPKVEVASGNFEVDTIKFATSDDDVLKITVDEESTKAPSTIVLKDVKVDVDRTVAVGPMKFSVYGRAIDEVSETDEDVEDNAIKFVAGNVVTPAGSVSAVFSIGSGIYTVNGVAQVMDVAPYIKEGRTYVPVRYLAYALGVSEDNVQYENGVVTLTKGDKVVKLTIGSKTMDVNGTTSTMDVAPETNNGRTMLPARFVAEALGATVGYANGQVVINQ
ncbi:Copper amine oxidase N-terminal domain-containing protein [Desulforamulus putei DSM 12395]|uniref:Copper amine oxidase N-terminal domain-containing protein n=1 Tax=Desulforamulus putei DSM 12395 TaxID=1121429 RepID=A0A1M4XST1_9FIRM|nr:copper amine oxidase N-terminal domain-containing protein [Desulforamulus putei]SHE96505.1 Copper amine oxidase N-terminal domain-containing protein [Desulforamulus putei DSM 12395]